MNGFLLDLTMCGWPAHAALTAATTTAPERRAALSAPRLPRQALQPLRRLSAAAADVAQQCAHRRVAQVWQRGDIAHVGSVGHQAFACFLGSRRRALEGRRRRPRRIAP